MDAEKGKNHKSQVENRKCQSSSFSILNSKLYCSIWPSFGRRPKRRASTIGTICAFESKIYKNVCHIFVISAFGAKNNKFFDFFYFYSALPTLLVEDFLKNRPCLQRNIKNLLFYLFMCIIFPKA